MCYPYASHYVSVYRVVSDDCMYNAILLNTATFFLYIRSSRIFTAFIYIERVRLS
jgi:hypothetical protein